MELDWEAALYIDDETAQLLFDAADSVEDVPQAECDLIEHPDIHSLFMFYNNKYFSGALNGVEVKWSSRMTLCVFSAWPSVHKNYLRRTRAAEDC
jgi:hypothetical protein